MISGDYEANVLNFVEFKVVAILDYNDSFKSTGGSE